MELVYIVSNKLFDTNNNTDRWSNDTDPTQMGDRGRPRNNVTPSTRSNINGITIQIQYKWVVVQGAA